MVNVEVFPVVPIPEFWQPSVTVSPVPPKQNPYHPASGVIAPAKTEAEENIVKQAKSASIFFIIKFS